MFKKFIPSESISSQSQAKTSVHRNIKKSILDSFPSIEPFIDLILPKKTPLYVVKCTGHVSLIVVNKEALFFSVREDKYIPTLKLLHKFPDIMPLVQVDRGAIKFVLKGADIMCPGLTSKGGNLDLSNNIEVNSTVAILAEGKQTILAIGTVKMSLNDIKTINKGTAIETLHYLNDGLWTTQQFEG